MGARRARGQVDRGGAGRGGGVAVGVLEGHREGVGRGLLLVGLLNALEVMASWVPVPAVMVSCWVPEVRPAAAAVMVGVPAFCRRSRRSPRRCWPAG